MGDLINNHYHAVLQNRRDIDLNPTFVERDALLSLLIEIATRTANLGANCIFNT